VGRKENGPSAARSENAPPLLEIRSTLPNASFSGFLFIVRYSKKKTPAPEANVAEPLKLVGRVLKVCLLASGVRLAEENKPQDEEVNQDEDNA
jgi:hypothetical protein